MLIKSRGICTSFAFAFIFLGFSMNTTHLFWLASVKSFAKIIFTVCKGNGPHYFVTSGVTVGSRMLWAKPWPGMCNVSLFFLFTFSTYPLLFIYSGLDWIISRVDDEECNDVGFKDALVMQDIQPIGALSRVVLGTLMKQPWVPYEYKCLLFCFGFVDPDGLWLLYGWNVGNVLLHILPH